MELEAMLDSVRRVCFAFYNVYPSPCTDGNTNLSVLFSPKIALELYVNGWKESIKSTRDYFSKK